MFSLYYNFIWKTLYTIYFRDLSKLSLTYELYTWALVDSERFLKFLVSPENEDSVF